jgi:transcriptional regulator with XRE-family HTH domain
MDVRELVERVLATVDGNQAELGRRLGRSETTISRWVTGKTGIDYESALRIARMTGLPPRQVLESAGLDADLFPAASGQVEPAEAEWNALYDQISAEHRPTIIAMVRAAVQPTRAANRRRDGVTTGRPGPHRVLDAHTRLPAEPDDQGGLSTVYRSVKAPTASISSASVLAFLKRLLGPLNRLPAAQTPVVA